jgi:cellulose biosynthesis protein BcsQ
MILAVINNKDGTGKTTTSVNLADEIINKARRGK